MVITASEARSQLFPLIERVNADSAPIFITSKKGNAVLVSESEWESMIETMYLLRTTANRERLARSIEEAKTGALFEYALPLEKSAAGKRVNTRKSGPVTTLRAKKSRKSSTK